MLLDGVSQSPLAVRVQVEEVVRSVISSDYPERWPSLLPALQARLAGGDQAATAGALRALRVLARKFEFKDEDERNPLGAVVGGTFPLLLPIFQSLVANPSPSVDLADMLKLCCKTFWSACYLEMPALLAQEEQFRG